MHRCPLTTILSAAIVLLLQSVEVWAEKPAFDTEASAFVLPADAVDYPIIFVHGIGGGFRDWESTAETISGGSHFRMRYQRDGTLYHNYNGVAPQTTNWVWLVSYYHDRPVKEALTGDLKTYAKRLGEMVTVIKRLCGREKVILICHSMGGLVGRASMSLDDSSWESVHKIITVATPHEGVRTSIGIVGQLKDLRRGSPFLNRLNQDWRHRINLGYNGWGVVGAIDIGPEKVPDRDRAGSMTDSAGIGFVELSSAIPFSEWQSCLADHFEQPAFNTPHFGYRVAIRGRHNEVLTSAPVYRAIEWSLRR